MLIVPPQNIKEGIEGHAVSWYSEVFDLVFPGVDKEAANNLWKAQLTAPPAEPAPVSPPA
jgi:Lon-like ATP-dependent protease